MYSSRGLPLLSLRAWSAPISELPEPCEQSQSSSSARKSVTPCQSQSTVKTNSMQTSSLYVFVFACPTHWQKHHKVDTDADAQQSSCCKWFSMNITDQWRNFAAKKNRGRTACWQAVLRWVQRNRLLQSCTMHTISINTLYDCVILFLYYQILGSNEVINKNTYFIYFHILFRHYWLEQSRLSHRPRPQRPGKKSRERAKRRIANAKAGAVRFPARLFHGERQVPLAIQRAINHLHPFARCFGTKSLLAILQDRCKIRNRFEFIIVEQLNMCFGKYKGAEKWMIAVQLRLIVTDPGIEQPLRFFTAPADPPNRTLPQTTYIQLYTFSISYITWKKPQVDSRPTATKIIAQHSRTGLGAKHGLHWWRRRPALKSADHWSRWMKSWHELRFSDTPGHING